MFDIMDDFFEFLGHLCIRFGGFRQLLLQLFYCQAMFPGRPIETIQMGNAPSDDLISFEFNMSPGGRTIL